MRLTSGPFATPNKVLSTLPPDELNAIRACMTRIRLVPRQTLIESGQTAEHLFFVEEGIASLIAESDDGSQGVQVAMIGREGMVGSLAVLGEAAAYGSVVMQVPGPALRISRSNLLTCFETCPELRARCWEYVQSLTRQIMSTAASNARNTLVQRCVRWLLMTHDRGDGDELYVTHEALSMMLGVRRSGVTVATASLQERGLIKTGRGRIWILDRAGLEAAAASRVETRRGPPSLAHPNPSRAVQVESRA